MKSNMKIPNSDDVDLKILILSLWKEKYLFLSITLLFLFLGYLYSLTLNKNVEFTSRIKTTPPPLEFFTTYETFFDEVTIPFRGESFTISFNSNFYSLDNLEKYIDQNNDIDNFKNYLKKTNLTPRKFFKPRLQQVTTKVDNQTNVVLEGQYYLTYPAILDGSKFLDEYANFIKDLTMSEFKAQKTVQILNIVKVYEQNLEISEAILLDNPIIQNFDGLIQSNILTEPNDSFYQGSIILSKRIEHLGIMLETLKKNFEYNAISERAIVIKSNFKNTTTPIIFGLIIGLFLSFLVILFRSILK